MVEGARLESVCRLIPYRGFESLPLRHSFPGGGTSWPLMAREGAGGQLIKIGSSVTLVCGDAPPSVFCKTRSFEPTNYQATYC